MILMLNESEPARADLSSYCDDPLVRAVINSLFSWAPAQPGDSVPDGEAQGWWGDTYASEPNDVFGSRLWELLRGKVTQETLAKAGEYAKEALQWLIDDAVAESVAATAERSDLGRVDLLIRVKKPKADALSIRFQDVWRNV